MKKSFFILICQIYGTNLGSQELVQLIGGYQMTKLIHHVKLKLYEAFGNYFLSRHCFMEEIIEIVVQVKFKKSFFRVYQQLYIFENEQNQRKAYVSFHLALNFDEEMKYLSEVIEMFLCSDQSINSIYKVTLKRFLAEAIFNNR